MKPGMQEHGPVDDTGSHDHHLDRAARRLHAQSLQALSSQTLSRLRSARHATVSAAPARRWLGWWVAGSSAAVLALVLSSRLQLPTQAPRQRIAGTTTIEELHAAGLGDEYESLVAGLDENPELYLWLASNGDTLALPTER